MSHHIDTMAYAKSLPWHGLGTYVGDENISAAEMMKKAGLDWNVRSLEISSAVQPGRPPEERIKVNALGHRVLVRSDRSTVLGTCKGTYIPFDNSEVFAFLDTFAKDGLRYHTAGSLFNGEQVWVLAEAGEQLSLRRRDGSSDQIAPFILCRAGHDGQTPIILQPTSVRVVCFNTLSMALSSGKTEAYRIKHTASASDKLRQARDAMLASAEGLADFVRIGEELDRTRIDRDTFAAFAMALVLDLPDDKTETPAETMRAAQAILTDQAMSYAQRERKQKRTEKILGDFYGLFTRGIGNSGETRYDALNAVTEYVDHARQRARRGIRTAEQLSRDSESAWAGTGARRKAKALKLLTRW